MKKYNKIITIISTFFVLMLVGCGSSKSNNNLQNDIGDTAVVTDNTAVVTDDTAVVTADTIANDNEKTSENIVKNHLSPENDYADGLKNIKVDSDVYNLTDEQKNLIEYFDCDYLQSTDYEFMRRYPNIFEGAQITTIGMVKKIISMDNNQFKLVVWLNVLPYFEEYATEGEYVIISGKTNPAGWYMENDLLETYGRYKGVETIEIDGTSYTLPYVEAYKSNICYAYKAFILDDKFDYPFIKSVAKTIFGNDIEIREAEREDFTEETAMIYEHTVGSYPYYLVELENQNNANFTKFLFSKSKGLIIDNKDPFRNDVIERYVEFAPDFEHYILFTHNKNLGSLELAYYDKEFKKIWEREFEETTNTVYDYTTENIYIVVNNELYTINTRTGEDTFAPSYVGERKEIRKFSDGVLSVSANKSDGLIKTDLQGKIIWKVNLSADVYRVGGIQLVGDNYILQYSDEQYKDYYVLVNVKSGEIIASAELSKN